MPRAEIADALLNRVKSEFLEMPGLCLTESQARRLWALDNQRCALVLKALVEARFLVRTGNGSFARFDAPTRARTSAHGRRSPGGATVSN